MATNTQFSIAVHVMAGLGAYQDRTVTTTDLAESVNATASFVRVVTNPALTNGALKTAPPLPSRVWPAAWVRVPGPWTVTSG